MKAVVFQGPFKLYRRMVAREAAPHTSRLEAVGSGDVGLARGQHVREEEGLAESYQRVGKRLRFDGADQPELGDATAQPPRRSRSRSAPAAQVGEYAQRQGRLVVEERSQALG